MVAKQPLLLNSHLVWVLSTYPLIRSAEGKQCPEKFRSGSLSRLSLFCCCTWVWYTMKEYRPICVHILRRSFSISYRFTRCIRHSARCNIPYKRGCYFLTWTLPCFQNSNPPWAACYPPRPRKERKCKTQRLPNNGVALLLHVNKESQTWVLNFLHAYPTEFMSFIGLNRLDQCKNLEIHGNPNYCRAIVQVLLTWPHTCNIPIPCISYFYPFFW